MTDDKRSQMLQKLVLAVCYAADEAKWPEGDGSIKIQDIHTVVGSIFREVAACRRSTTGDEICEGVRQEVLRGPDACLAFLRRHLPVAEVA